MVAVCSTIWVKYRFFELEIQFALADHAVHNHHARPVWREHGVNWEVVVLCFGMGKAAVRLMASDANQTEASNEYKPHHQERVALLLESERGLSERWCPLRDTEGGGEEAGGGRVGGVSG